MKIENKKTPTPIQGQRAMHNRQDVHSGGTYSCRFPALLMAVDIRQLIEAGYLSTRKLFCQQPCFMRRRVTATVVLVNPGGRRNDGYAVYVRKRVKQLFASLAWVCVVPFK